jgi:site-specific DNA recombinase
MTVTNQTPTSDGMPDVAEAVSYLRVSTKEQAERDGDPEGYSIPAQREANRRKAAELKAVIVDEFIDRGESARSYDRPDLQRMLRYIKEHPSVRYVIVHKIDRLARNRVDDVEINLAIQRAGATLVSCTENIDETPSGMLLHGIMSTIAEFYSRNLANEVIKGMSQKAKTGGTPTKAPLGYRNVRRLNDEGREIRTVELDPARAPLITWAYEAYATGDWTLKRLLEALTARGLTNTPTSKLPVRPLHLSHLYKIMTNPYYKGEVVWRGARHPGRHTPLVDAATWQRVQEVLAAHRPGEKERVHHHYLKSTVYCGDCGSRLIVTNAKSRYGVIYPYYVCLGRHQKTTTCTRKATLIPVIEELVEDHYAEVQLPAEMRERIETVLHEELAASRAETDAERIDVQRQQGRLRSEQAKLLQAHYANAIPLDLLKTEQDRIAGQLEVIEAKLAALQTHFETIEANLKSALDLASDCHRAYQQAGPTVRRMFNQAFFVKLYIDEDGVRAELAEPFKTLLDPNLLDNLDGDRTAPDEQEASKPGLTATQAAYLRRHKEARRKRRPAGHPQHTAQRAYVGAGLKQNVLVPPAGFEPATHGLGNRCSIP